LQTAAEVKSTKQARTVSVLACPSSTAYFTAVEIA
jgi:hypothetical protein